MNANQSDYETLASNVEAANGSSVAVASAAPIGGQISKFERLTLAGGQELDRAIEWLAGKITDFTLHDRIGAFDLAGLEKAIRFYDDPLRSAPASGFFQRPDLPPLIEKKAIVALPDGYIHDISFESAYTPAYEGYRSDYDSTPVNKIVHARYWQHNVDKAARATVIAVHGWTMGDQRINSLAFQPGFFFARGMDVVLVELPFHGRRAAASKGGEPNNLFPSGDFVRTNESVLQAICDLRQLYRYLSESGATGIGVMGMSLGGYVAALWASLDKLGFCIPIVPMASMAQLAWEVLSKSPRSQELVASGITLKKLERIYRFHCPLSYSHAQSHEDILIVAGMADTVVPPGQPTTLWRHWGQPAMFWYKGGHLAEFNKTDVFDVIFKFIERRTRS
jgi:dienelactone hydrolase